MFGKPEFMATMSSFFIGDGKVQVLNCHQEIKTK